MAGAMEKYTLFWHLQKSPNLFYGKLFIENFDWEIFVNVIATTWARFGVTKLICVLNICNGKKSNPSFSIGN